MCPNICQLSIHTHTNRPCNHHFCLKWFIDWQEPQKDNLIHNFNANHNSKWQIRWLKFLSDFDRTRQTLCVKGVKALLHTRDEIRKCRSLLWPDTYHLSLGLIDCLSAGPHQKFPHFESFSQFTTLRETCHHSSGLAEMWNVAFILCNAQRQPPQNS